MPRGAGRRARHQNVPSAIDEEEIHPPAPEGAAPAAPAPGFAPSPRATFVDRFLSEARWSNARLASVYPDLYDGVRLNWVKAFGAGGETLCCSLEDMPTAYWVYRLAFMIAIVSLVAYDASVEAPLDGGWLWLMYLTNLQLLASAAYGVTAWYAATMIRINHPLTLKRRLNSVRGATGISPSRLNQDELAQLAGATCPTRMPLYCTLTWLCFNVAFIYSLFVTVVFWS